MTTPFRLLAAAGLAIALILAAWNHRQVTRLRADLAGLREASRDDAATGTTAAPASPAGPGQGTDPELVALRGEVAALHREIRALAEDAARRPDVAAAAANTPVRTLPPHLRHGWIEAAGLPDPVLATLRQQLGDLPIEGAHVKQSEGRLFYAIETRLPDGRGIELAMDDSGQIRHRHLETPFGALDPALQQAAAGQVGDTPIRAAAEIYEDGQTRYRVTAKSPEQGIQVILAPDGTVLRTEISRPEREP